MTNEQRKFLNESSGQYLYDTILGFIKAFNLTPEQAGRLIAKWIKETY